MAAAAIWKKNEKSPYIGRSPSNFNEIWHGYAVQPSWPFRTLKNFKFWKSKMAAAAILKNWKIAISQPRFELFRWNLAHWCTYHNLPWYWYCFRGRVRLGGKSRFWCAACKSVSRTCSTSTLFHVIQQYNPCLCIFFCSEFKPASQWEKLQSIYRELSTWYNAKMSYVNSHRYYYVTLVTVAR